MPASDDASMATNEVLEVSNKIEKEDGVNGIQDGVGAQRSEGSSTQAVEAVTAATDKPTEHKDVSPARQEPSPAPATSRGTSVNGSTPTTGNTHSISMPHPKKFSHVDINKRFLGKNSPTASTSQSSSPSVTSKPGSSTQKPVLQTVVTHSKLVTAKLTTDIQRSATAGPGWSRPPSSSSSVAATPSVTAGTPKTTPAPGSTPGHAAPQLPTAGRVIQPQPRGALEAPLMTRRDSAGKSAWGTKPPASLLNKVETANEEFPTAAEVAQARLVEKKPPPPPTAAQKQAAVDADAFRGVHLGPNVHHWDEDEGDDSGFLDEVIQFDDGRQYTVQQTQETESASLAAGKDEVPHDGPVSKEERFADDFDRSWPPSRPTKAPSQSGPQPLHSPTASSQSMHSPPQDSSRHLFNERSNRLEPYSSSRSAAPPRDPYFARRGSRSEAVVSPTEFRNGREHGVQLLQKPLHPGRDGFAVEDRLPSRARLPGDRQLPSPHDSSYRDRDGPRRDHAAPPHMSRTTSRGFDHIRSRDHHDHPGPGGPSDPSRRLSNVESRSPMSPSESFKEGRPLPPHLSGTQSQSNAWRAPPMADRTRRLSTTSSVGAASVQQPSLSPVVPHATLSPQAETAAPPTPSVDMDEVRKAAMHSAAERARARRQQEEAEREKERERARRKAAELEAKMKAVEDSTKTAVPEKRDEATAIDSEVVSIIENAVRSATQIVESPLAAVPEESSTPLTTVGSNATRAPSARGVARPPRRPSFADSASPATQTDSWRSKKLPPRYSQSETQIESASPSTVIPPASLPLLAQVDHLSITEDETLEVIDFADFGKLIEPRSTEGNSQAPKSPIPEPNVIPRRPPRPVATDFFQDQEETRSPSESNRTWRRKSSTADEHPHLSSASATQAPVLDAQVESPRELPRLQVTTDVAYTTSPMALHARPSASFDEVGRSQGEHGPARLSTSPQAHLAHAYREAPMSALDDTMARFKAALDGMHKPPEPKQRWLPPALRQRTGGDEPTLQPRRHTEHDDHREVFDITGLEPPRSPEPAWNRFMVRLPRSSLPKEPVSPKRLRFFVGRPFIRLDVHSFNPPIENMHRRGFQLNDALFGKPYMVKGRPKYEVKLPAVGDLEDIPSGPPVVKLPAKPGLPQSSISNGAFGRLREADGVSSWRKPPSSPLRHQSKDKDLLEPPVGQLDTVSRSPPPETPSVSTGTSAPGQTDTSMSPVITVPSTKAKEQANVPDVPAVAFYRDSPAEAKGWASSSAVQFIVSSELEEEAANKQITHAEVSAPVFPTLNAASVGPLHSEAPLRPEPLSSIKDPIVEFRKGNRSPVQAPITPPSHVTNLPSLTWAAQREAAAKESPSRLPDREHLKAVWSSTSDKADLPAVNSLKGIADDLPLVIQNPKLEDIPTPPLNPSSHASRLSIMHDITRTFQQVPISSSSSSTAHTNHSSKASATSMQSNLNTHASPSITSPAQRQPQPPTTMPPGMRVAYGGYPSPMLSSPSPTIYPSPMTPSPIPAPMGMNGVPQYHPPPMWMAMPPPNGPTGMMRPMASPYGAQLMPYPPPHAGPMYPPPAPNMQGPGSPNVQGRHGNAMLTPGASHSGHHSSMYATSPVLMHAMPPPAMPGSPYQPPTHHRGVPPPRGSYDKHPGMVQQSPSFGPQQSAAYSTVSPNTFARPSW